MSAAAKAVGHEELARFIVKFSSSMAPANVTPRSSRKVWSGPICAVPMAMACRACRAM